MWGLGRRELVRGIGQERRLIGCLARSRFYCFPWGREGKRPKTSSVSVSACRPLKSSVLPVIDPFREATCVKRNHCIQRLL
jgi:hypothetical protein